MANEEKKKSSFLSKDISFGKKSASTYPTKKSMNFIVDEKGKNEKQTYIGLVIFLILAALFVKFGIYDQLAKINDAERNYNTMMTQVNTFKSSIEGYDEVLAQYNDLVGTFLSPDELGSMTRPDIIRMLDEDIFPHVAVQSIQVSGNLVTVRTGNTKLATVSNLIDILQRDERNTYVTVTTAAAANRNEDDNDTVTADIQIVFASVSEATEGGAQ